MSRGTGSTVSYTSESTVTYAVRGLTCGWCVAELMEQVQVLPGVQAVAVDLVVDGESPLTVRSGQGATLPADDAGRSRS